MFKRYHVPAAPAPSRRPWARVDVLRDLKRCLNCGTCADSCLYGVHHRKDADPRLIAEPDSHLCRVCFRCVQECPVGALTLARNPAFVESGNGLFTPEILRTLGGEAEAGRIPVTGSAYRGPFGGQGFDGMWTDMSEIVRPTRDGIHGREYISTSVDVGFRPTRLDFTERPEWVPPREVPLPILLDAAAPGRPPDGVLAAVATAARRLGTYAIVPATVREDSLHGVLDTAIVRLADGATDGPREALGLEVPWGPGAGPALRALREARRPTLLSLRIPLSAYTRDAVDAALGARADLIHLAADWRDVDDLAGVNAFIRTLRDLHRHLVGKSVRDSVTVLASGPIATAEHVPKTIILGADLVAASHALYVAMECVPPDHALHLGRFPEDFPLNDAEWAAQRVVNLMNAWRDQLLEVLGAMGMREVRRLRGEVGRAIFQEDAEREAFGDIRVRAPAKEVAAR